MKKKRFLAVYDYGQGGVWAIICAHNKADILKKYPELKIYGRKPMFMSGLTYKKILEGTPQDIDDPPTGWLAELAKSRS